MASNPMNYTPAVWTEEEKAIFRRELGKMPIGSELGGDFWMRVARQLPGKTAADVARKYILDAKNYTPAVWTDEEKAIFRQELGKLPIGSELGGEFWLRVAQKLPGKTTADVARKYMLDSETLDMILEQGLASIRTPRRDDDDKDRKPPGNVLKTAAAGASDVGKGSRGRNSKGGR